MIIIIKNHVEDAKIAELTAWLEENFDVKVRKDRGSHTTILGLVGDTAHLDVDSIQSHGKYRANPTGVRALVVAGLPSMCHGVSMEFMVR